MTGIYTYVTEETVTRAYERAFNELDEMTEGRADAALELMEELNELSRILEDIEKNKE